MTRIFLCVARMALPALRLSVWYRKIIYRSTSCL